MQDPTLTKSASLANVKVHHQESESARAARFFATHGMKKMGHLLGDEMSAKAEKKALQERAAAEATIKVQVPESKAAAAVSEASFGGDDIDMPEEDDEEADLKKKWAAVDALKQRHVVFTQE